jgi:rubredoxin
VTFVGKYQGPGCAAQNEGENVVDYCANSKCMKPLHYLREGTVYIFEIADGDDEGSAPSTHKLRHYWLCGECSMDHRLERTPKREVRLVPKQPQRFVRRPVQPAIEHILTSKIA